MMAPGMVALSCNICGEPSTAICVYCTKDACVNHRCDRCKRCSDCCECDVPLSAEELPLAPPVEPFIEPPFVEPGMAMETEALFLGPEPPEPAPAFPTREETPGEETME
jgi:hypothetical protein